MFFSNITNETILYNLTAMLNMITLIITTKMFNVPKHFWNPDLSSILASVYPRKGILCQCKIRFIIISFHGRFVSLYQKKLLENKLLSKNMKQDLYI